MENLRVSGSCAFSMCRMFFISIYLIFISFFGRLQYLFKIFSIRSCFLFQHSNQPRIKCNANQLNPIPQITTQLRLNLLPRQHQLNQRFILLFTLIKKINHMILKSKYKMPQHIHNSLFFP